MTAPALVLAIPLVLGVLFGSSRGGEPPVDVPALLVTWTLAAIATWWSAARTPGPAQTSGRAAGRSRAVAAIAAICVSTFAAGAMLGAEARRTADRPSLLADYD